MQLLLKEKILRINLIELQKMYIYVFVARRICMQIKAYHAEKGYCSFCFTRDSEDKIWIKAIADNAPNKMVFKKEV